MAEASSTTVLRRTERPVRTEESSSRGAQVIGRYTLHAPIGVGGMASVHLGWVVGPGDFSRLVAIKRMHPQLSDEQQFVARFRDEAWLSARLLHPNIVQTFDVVDSGGELLIIMEYIHGVSLRALWTDARAAGTTLPLDVVAGILVPALHGLHAAHEATDDHGHPIGIVHRDFSPQNIMAGTDGHAKILDFGIAKARTHLHVTSTGALSGKLGYMAPEQIQGSTLDRQVDVFAAGIVLWEMLTGRRLFCEPGVDEPAALFRVLQQPIKPPHLFNATVPHRLSDITLHALERAPRDRFESARALALAIEGAVDIASPSRVAEWIGRTCSQRVAILAQMLADSRRAMAEAQSATVAPVVATLPALSTDEAPTAVTVNAKTPTRVQVERPGTWKWVGLCAVCTALGLGVSLRGHLPGQSRGPVSAKDMVSSRPQRETAIPVLHAPAPAPPVAASAAPSAPDVASAPLRAVGVGTIPRTGKPHSSVKSGSPEAAYKPPGATKKTLRPNCDPPTYIDSDGIRIFKDECL